MLSSKKEHVQINLINKDKGSIFEDQNKTKQGSFCGLSLAILTIKKTAKKKKRWIKLFIKKTHQNRLVDRF